jgi:hypothetical protein
MRIATSVPDRFTDFDGIPPRQRHFSSVPPENPVAGCRFR